MCDTLNQCARKGGIKWGSDYCDIPYTDTKELQFQRL